MGQPFNPAIFPVRLNKNTHIFGVSSMFGQTKLQSDPPSNSSQLYLKALEAIHVDEGFGVEHLHDLSPRFETQHLMG